MKKLIILQLVWSIVKVIVDKKNEETRSKIKMIMFWGVNLEARTILPIALFIV
ncbi:MAG: hypothetical protein IJE43_10755 [Alphaproteobacteria bacterium]|nr:hypothetical protein [Alphaproteobacteria bacterium]